MSKKEIIQSLNYLKKEISDIKKEISNIKNEDKELMHMILDSYEIDHKCFDFIMMQNKSWFELFYKTIETILDENNSDIVVCVEELKLYDTENESYQSFINYIKYELNKYNYPKKIELNLNDNMNDNINDNTNNDIADNKDELNYMIEINQEDILCEAKFEGLRKNQELAREQNKKQNFCSGIHNQITGAGKSIIMILTINDHNEKEKSNNNGRLYIVTCPRIEVLNKLFFEKKDDVYILNQKNKNFWKDNKLIDLNNFHIIDRVNVKNKKKIKLCKNKPNILIVNTDYLKTLDAAKSFKYSKVNLILFDECHGVSAENFYNLLRKIKFTHKIHIMGFSATPVRDNAEGKVKQIFSSSLDKIKNPKLNIISNYDMINAMWDNIILPPSYTIVEINKTCNKKIGKSNKDISERVIKNMLDVLPYKKLICWCGTIEKLKEWHAFFSIRFPELKLYTSTSKDKEHVNFDTEFDKFCETKKNCILLCVNRCREGSDIKNIDCGIYMDNVKKRGILVSIQTVGRILRPDKNKLKKSGHIIDTFINDGKIEIETMTAQKVINYYEKVFSLSAEENYKGMLDIYTKIKNMCADTDYDCKTNKIKIKIDNNPKHDTVIKLELTTKNFDWIKFKDKIGKIIDDNFGVNKQEQFNLIIDKLKKTKKFNVGESFWDVYNKLDKTSLHLETQEDFYSEYKDFFDNSSWFEIMNFDISNYYKTIPECVESINNLLKNKPDINSINDETYDIFRIYDKKLPPFPKEYFKKSFFTTVEKEFGKNIKHSKKYFI